MNHAIYHLPASHRFATDVDGHTGYVEYQPQGEVIAITHTIVPSEIGGRGIAAELVRAALEHAREHGLKIDPQCSYAASYLDKHAEYADLRKTD